MQNTKKRKGPKAPALDSPMDTKAVQKPPNADKARREKKNVARARHATTASDINNSQDEQTLLPDLSSQNHFSQATDTDMEYESDSQDEESKPNDEAPIEQNVFAETLDEVDTRFGDSSGSPRSGHETTPRGFAQCQHPVSPPTTPTRGSTSTNHARATTSEHCLNTPETTRKRTTRTRDSQNSSLESTTKIGFEDELHKRYSAERQRFEDRWKVLRDIAKTLDEKFTEHASNPDIADFASGVKDQVVKLLHSLSNLNSTTPQDERMLQVEPDCPSLQSGKRTYADAAKATGTTKGLSSSIHSREGFSPSSQQAPRSSAPRSSCPPPQPRTDTRIFARLPDDNQMKMADPFAILNRLRNMLAHEANLVHTVQRTKSGFAIVPNRAIDSAKTRLLQLREPIKQTLGADAVEENTPWTTLILPSVPKSYSDGTEPQPITRDLLRSEIVRITGSTPTYVNWTRSSADNPTTGAVIVSFNQEETPTDPFRLFCTGPLSRILPPRKTKPIQCQTCYKWHVNSNLRCWSESRCKNCGQAAHGDIPCASTKCRNCRGPHPADDVKCPARPYFENGRYIYYTKAQIQAIRLAQKLKRDKTSQPSDKEDNGPGPVSQPSETPTSTLMDSGPALPSHPIESAPEAKDVSTSRA